MRKARRASAAYAALVLTIILLSYVHPVSSQSTTSYLTLGGYPWGITFDPVNGHVYVANTAGFVSVVDPAANVALQNITFPLDKGVFNPSLTDINFDNATGKIFVIDLLLPGLWIINPATNSVVGNITIPTSPNQSPTPRFLASGGGKLFVSVDYYTSKPSSVLAFDTTTLALVSNVTMPTGNLPQMLSYDPVNGYVYVAGGNANETTVINSRTGSIVTNIPVGNAPYAVSYNAGEVFVTESSSNLVAVINASTNSLAGLILCPKYPLAVLALTDPGTNYLFVYGNSTVELLKQIAPLSFTFVNYPFPYLLTLMTFDPQVDGGIFIGAYQRDPSIGGIESWNDPFASLPTSSSSTSSSTSTSSTTSTSTSSTTLTSSFSTSSTSSSSSGSSSSVSTASTSTSQSTSSTPPPSSGVPGDVIDIVIALLILLGAGGYFLWRRSQNQPKAQPPPETPPMTQEKPKGTPPTIPPYVPPVVPGTATHEEEQVCDCGEKDKDSGPRTDIEISKHWDQKYDEDTGKGDLEQAIEDSIKTKGGWDREAVGTAVAHSEGATFGASVDAGAKIWIMEGDQRRLSSTNKLDVSSEGETEIEIEVEAPKEAKTTVSAAVLAAVKAHASVLDVNASIFENLETFDFFEKFFTVALNLSPPRANHPEEFKKELEEVKKALDAIKEAAKESTTGEEYRELLKEAKDISRALLKDLGAELTAEIVIPMLIEKVGRWLWVNADVDVEVEGKFDVTVGTCGTQSIDAMASRKLEVKSGDVEQPLGDEYTESHSRKIVESCSAPRELKIVIKGEGKASGQAYDGGEGNAYLDSLWAAAWVCCCQTESGEKRNNFGFTFKALFTIPPEVEEKHQDVASGVMRKTIMNWMRNDLQARLDGAAIPCSFDNPKPTEDKLKEILTKWMEATGKQWHLFS